MTTPKRIKNCCITWNNPLEKRPVWNATKMDYLIFQKEEGKSKTPHYQIYVEFKNQIALSTIKKLFDNTVHVEARRGTARQAADYCKKDEGRLEPWEEFGEMSNQGQRTDLNDLRDVIMSGEKDADTICVENPTAYHQYGRTLMKLEDLLLRKKERSEMTKGYWYWGPTGTGKSHKAYNDIILERRYTYPSDNGWWDGYKGQEIVIINDFRGGIPYGELLQMVDKWPYNVRRRNREPAPFISKTVIITSALHPKDVYCNISQLDKLEQLYRRFEVIELEQSRDPPPSPQGIPEGYHPPAL